MPHVSLNFCSPAGSGSKMLSCSLFYSCKLECRRINSQGCITSSAPELHPCELIARRGSWPSTGPGVPRVQTRGWIRPGQLHTHWLCPHACSASCKHLQLNFKRSQVHPNTKLIQRLKPHYSPSVQASLPFWMRCPAPAPHSTGIAGLKEHVVVASGNKSNKTMIKKYTALSNPLNCL